MNGKDREYSQMYTDMAATAGKTISVQWERTAEAQARDGLDTTISEQAMRDLNQQMLTWVGTRMIRYQEQTGLAVQNVKVTLTVEVSA
jgi:hypothetical protein